MNREEKLNCFTNELACITDSGLREFVENIIEGTGDWFFHDPASTSGRYHPKFALGDGGLVRHTRAVVYWVKELYRSELFNVDAHQFELLIAAALLHDIRKHTAEGGYIQTHARAAYNLIMEQQEKHKNLIHPSEAAYMADAVSTHMGVWGVKDGERKPTTDSEKLLHLADLMASRKEISMDIFNSPALDLKLPKIPSVKIVGKPKTEADNVLIVESTDKGEDTSGLFVITFGKYKDKTINEIYSMDKGYLNWIANNKDFFNAEAQDIVKTYLATKKE